MPKITYRFATENQAVFYRTMKQQERQLAIVNNKLANLGNAGKKSIGGLSSELKNVISGLIGPMGLAGAIMEVTSNLKKAYQEMRERGKETFNLNQSLGEARATAMLNLPRDFEGGGAELDSMVEKIADDAKLGRKAIWQGMSPALSAKGSATNKEFLEAAGLAAKIEKKTGGDIQMGPLVGSLLDIQKATGINKANANLGWLRQSGAASRITSLEGQLQMVPGIGAARARGITSEHAMEIQTAISQIIMDDKGEKTRTGFVNLLKDLYTEDLLPSVQKTSKGRKTEWSGLSGGIYERIKAVQDAYASGDDQTKKDIEKKFGGRAGMSPFMIAMLESTELFQKTLTATQRQVGAPDIQAAAETKKYFQDIARGDAGKTAAIAHESESIKEKAKLAKENTQESYDEAARDVYENVMKTRGVGWLTRNVRLKAMESESFFTGKDIEDIMLKTFNGIADRMADTQKKPQMKEIYARDPEYRAFEQMPKLLERMVKHLENIDNARKTKAPIKDPNQQDG